MSQFTFFIFDVYRKLSEKKNRKVVWIDPKHEVDRELRIYKSLGQYQEVEQEDLNSQIRKGKKVLFLYSEDKIYIDFQLDNDLVGFARCFRLIDNIEEMLKLSETTYDELEEFVRFNNFFTGPKFIGTKFDPKVIDSAKKNISILIVVLYQMLDAGYYEEKDEKRVYDWIIPFQQRVLRGIIREFGITTSAPDVDFVTEFLTNPQFRKMITECIMKVVANYIINNGLVKIEEIENWKSVDQWKSLEDLLKKYIRSKK